ncbi:tetratricopeptide repeat protein [Streptomyces sp. VMFN-G11Ma]|jgi:tetratricopeptide (TPR) repeat protein|nr:tetratricopeptide repeat protein [Streptomyces sp. VMFN-G11Ma]
MKAALLAALADGAGGDTGLRAVESLARALGLEADASVAELVGAAQDPARRVVVEKWGEELAGLLAADPRGAARDLARAMERDAPGSGTSWYAYGGDHADFRGGVFLREVVGVQVVIQAGEAAVPEALAGLPPRPRGFTGRAEETTALLAALDPAVAAPPSPVLLAAVSGLGGIGKTALAVETAYLACERGWFPGGVLFIDLHGYDQEPVAADHALQALLRALGTAPEHIPATADERAVLYRSVLAARGRERGAMLVLADNASSPDQVRPLLPGDSRHHVLVTSRDRMPQLGARLLRLDQLSPEGAQELLDRALRIADPEDSRVVDDADTAGRLAGLCGHLPLALQIAAALLAEDPDMPVAELVQELTESRDRLDHLDDGERSVRSAFELSYRRLPAEQARLLRLLALAPGPHVSEEVVAALVGTKAAPVRELKALARAHLVERGSGRGWWRMHDLVRVFGVGVVAGDARLREEGDAARERVLEFYVRWASEADGKLRWLPQTKEPERFRDRGQALAWLDGERPALVATIGWAREERFAGGALRLAQHLPVYLEWRRYADDWIAVMKTARDTAHQAGCHVDEAMAWDSLGLALLQAGRVREAVEAHISARDLLQAVGNRHREASAWGNLGAALKEAGRVEEAIEAHMHARDVFQAVGDRHNEASAWSNLGLALREAGRVGEAVEAAVRARDLFQAVGDRRYEAKAWYGLGLALREAGRVGEAVEAAVRARDLFQAVGDRHLEAIACHNLGGVLRQAGKAKEAVKPLAKALEIFQELQDWSNVALTLGSIARAHEAAHRPAEARTAYLRAADAWTRANAPAKAARARTRAADLDAHPANAAAPSPSPSGTAAPVAPPFRTADCGPPGPRPPGAPDSAGP